MTVASPPVLDAPRPGPAGTAADTLPTSVRVPAATPLRGFLEAASATEGLSGWALDTAQPDRGVVLEVLVGDALLLKCPTTLPRRDVTADGTSVPAGFHVTAARIADRLARLAPPPAADAPLTIRVAGTAHRLGARKALPTAAEWSRAAKPASAAAPPAPTLGRALGDLTLSPAVVAAALPEALIRLVAAAEPLRRIPLTPAADRTAGFLEEVAWEGGGLIWFFGWMRRHLPLHGSGMLTDGAKHPFGYAVASFPRADLPEGAHGVTGVLRTDWRPTPGRTPMLFLGDAAQHVLRGLDPLVLRTDAELAARLDAVGPSLAGPYVGALRALLATDQSWTPDNARAAGIEARASLDRVLVLPGFGCLAEGWMLSPHRAVRRLMLRAGTRTLLADPLAGSRKPRPDLAGSAPHAARMLATAGFTAAFVGAVEEVDLGDLTLKLVFADGASSNHRVPPESVRVLGASAAWEDALELFPALPAEAFFPAFARAVGAVLARDAAAVTGGGGEDAADPALIVAVPDDPHDLHLLFGELALLAARRPAVPALTLLARAGQQRGDVLTLMEELRLGGWRAGLRFVADPAYALHALPTLLEELGADRFAYVAAGLFPTQPGWDALLDGLAADGDGPLALPIEGPPGPEGLAAGLPDGFVWRARPFAAWLGTRPVLLGGAAAAALTLPEGTHMAGSGAIARRGRRTPLTRFARRINAELLAGDLHA